MRESAVIGFIPFVAVKRNPAPHCVFRWCGYSCYMRTVTPHRADVISIQDLEAAVCQPVPILMEENEVVQYLV